MGLLLKQSTSVDVLIGPFMDEDDGKTTEEALTIEDEHVLLSKLGQALAAKNDANDATHDDLGYYNCPLNATDTNTLGTLQLCCHMAGALPVYHEYMVVTANVWDTLCGADLFQTDLTQMGGVAQSATDLKDFADAGYDPATDKVTGVKLCDRTTLVDGVTLCDQTTLVDNVTLCDETTLVDTTTTNTDMVADVASDVTDIKAKTDLIGASVALETGGKIAGIETTLASPDNFKANVTNLDAAVSTRAPSGEYDTEVAHLDADISSRAPTSEYDTEMAHLDADITSRAPAGEYDTELDTTISSRAPASEYDTEMARITANVATETKQDTNATHLTDIKGGTFNGATDSLEAIRNRGDSAWISATTVDLNADQSAVTIGTVNTALALTANNDKTGYALAAAGIDGIWDEVIEGTLTGRQVLRLNLSALTGKSSGGGTATLIFRDNGDTKARITATVDEDGNRTAMTLDET